VLQQKKPENFNFDIGSNMVQPLYETHIRINSLIISIAQRTPVGKCVQLINVIAFTRIASRYFCVFEKMPGDLSQNNQYVLAVGGLNLYIKNVAHNSVSDAHWQL